MTMPSNKDMLCDKCHKKITGSYVMNDEGTMHHMCHLPSNKWEEAVDEILNEFQAQIQDGYTQPVNGWTTLKQEAKLALTNAVRELVETAKPWREYPTSDFADGIEAYQTNLLKAIGDK